MSGLSNLGGYGDVTAAMHAAGGPEAWLAARDAAVSAAVAPKVFGAGLVVGVALVGVTAYAVQVGAVLYDQQLRRREHARLVAETEARMRRRP